MKTKISTIKDLVNSRLEHFIDKSPVVIAHKKALAEMSKKIAELEEQMEIETKKFESENSELLHFEAALELLTPRRVRGRTGVTLQKQPVYATEQQEADCRLAEKLSPENLAQMISDSFKADILNALKKR